MCGSTAVTLPIPKADAFFLSSQTLLPFTIFIHTCPFNPFSPPADIMPGQGLIYMTLTKSWRLRNCTSNGYGVSNITYGLSPSPCRDCKYSVALKLLRISCSTCWGPVHKEGL